MNSIHLTETHQKTYRYYNRSLITLAQQAIPVSLLFTLRSHRISFYFDCVFCLGLCQTVSYHFITQCIGTQPNAILQLQSDIETEEKEEPYKIIALTHFIIRTANCVFSWKNVKIHREDYMCHSIIS